MFVSDNVVVRIINLFLCSVFVTMLAVECEDLR